MLKIAVLGSGRGSNFQAIFSAIQDGKIPLAEIVLVITNNAGAGILDLARKHGIPAVHLGNNQRADKLCELLHEAKVALVVLAGYMKKLDTRVVSAYRNRIINIHPALLPRFGGKGMYGLHVHDAVLRAGERESGATVHVVDEEYDHGRILLQQRVPVLDGDTPEALAQRVLSVEHSLYPDAIRLIAEGKLLPELTGAAVH